MIVAELHRNSVSYPPRPGTPGRGVRGEGIANPFAEEPLTPGPSPGSTGARGVIALCPNGAAEISLGQATNGSVALGDRITQTVP